MADREADVALQPMDHTTDAQENQNTKKNGLLRQLKRHYTKPVLCLVIVAVWMVLAVPTVLFYIPHAQESSPSELAVCVETEIYLGDACQEALQGLQSCLAGGQSGGLIYIPATGQQDELEMEAQTLFNALQALQLSQGCLEEVMPFLCYYLFNLCDGNGTLHQLSSRQCQDISGGTCASEWEWIEAVLRNGTLPDCNTLPYSSLDCYDGVTARGSGNVFPVPDKETNHNNSLKITCSEDFFFNGTTCQPECVEWEEFPPSQVKTVDGFVIFLGSAVVIISAATIVISCVQYKKMLKLPSILVFYQSINAFVIAVVILVGYTDRKTLFCTSKDLLESFHNPSIFCTISGIVTTYGIIQILFWWACHSLLVFWTIRFPHHYMESAGRIKYVHVILICLGVTFPAVHVAVTFGVGEFTITRFPPIVCLPNNEDATFYSIVLPVSILMATGVSLLVVVFYELLKTMKGKVWIAQAKVLTLLCFYVVLGAMALCSYTVVSRNLSEIQSELWEYFECESKGTSGEVCDTSGYTDINSQSAIPAAISFVLIGLIPFFNLLYVVQFQGLFKTVRAWCGHKHSERFSSSNSKSGKVQSNLAPLSST